MSSLLDDYREGETVYWAGKETTVRGAEHLFYGRPGKVVGEGNRLPAGKTVRVMFTDDAPAVETYIPLSAASLPSSDGATGAASSLMIRCAGSAVETPSTVEIPQRCGSAIQTPKPAVTRPNEVIHCFHPELSRTPPPPLPGGLKGGDQVFFCGVSRTLRSGDKFEHGTRGEVVGPDTSNVDSNEKVNVRFPGNKNAVGCYLTTLCQTWPPLAGNYKVGDCVHYAGASVTLDKDHQVRNGMLGEVVGAHPSDPDLVSVRFPGIKGELGCYVTELSRAWWRPAGAVAR